MEAAEKDNELQGEVGASLDLESKELGHAMARSSSAADKRCSKEEQAEQASKTTHIKIYRLGTWSLDIAGEAGKAKESKETKSRCARDIANWGESCVFVVAAHRKPEGYSLNES